MKQAYIVYEALLGLIILALILSIYLPGMYQLQQQFQQAEVDLENYRFFKELAEIALMSSDKVPVRIYEFEQQTQRHVGAFDCDAYRCTIKIDDQQYSVERSQG